MTQKLTLVENQGPDRLELVECLMGQNRGKVVPSLFMVTGSREFDCLNATVTGIDQCPASPDHYTIKGHFEYRGRMLPYTATYDARYRRGEIEMEETT